jgi:predicted RNA binding protein YcfA (HicA-like mRNA interferase family)
MPPKLRPFSGTDFVLILTKFGSAVHSQRGSHIKLRRITPQGHKQALTIVTHKELDRGTLHAIFRQASKYIAEEELEKYYYTE